MKEIVLGTGKVMIGIVKDANGHRGILFEPVDAPRPIGQADDSLIGQPVYYEKDGVVVWCGSLASTRVLQDVVGELALILQGYRDDVLTTTITPNQGAS